MQQFLKNGYMNDNMTVLLKNATTTFTKDPIKIMLYNTIIAKQCFFTNRMGLQTIFKEILSACA